MYKSIERNNTAVQLLRDGHCCDASLALKMAWLQLQVSFRSTKGSDGSHVEAERGATQVVGNLNSSSATLILDPSYASMKQSHKPPLKGTPIELEPSIHTDASDTYLVLYDKAFCLPPTESRERVVSSVILYNCALASHISGVLRGDSKNVTNAMELYKYSYRILHAVKGDADSTELLRLALCNNMGHACFQLFHVDDAAFYVQRLRDEMGLSDNNPRGDPLPTVADEDYDFFCFNVTCSVAIVGAPAA